MFTALTLCVCVVLELPLVSSMEELSPVVKKRLNSRNTLIRGKISRNNVEKYHDESVYFVGVSTIATNRTYVFSL